jgi:predicted enzyme related to lactoylglutathione lyase
MGAKKFYEGLFGWKATPGEGKDESSYLHISVNGKHFAGILPAGHSPSAHPFWMPYFLVKDINAMSAKAAELGGAVYVAPKNVDKSLWVSVLADPQGGVFCLFQA